MNKTVPFGLDSPITDAIGAKKYEGVQFLRFIAAVAVVFLHAAFYTRQRLTETPISFWGGGEWGVDIFFVISGFVMVVSSRDLMDHPRGWSIFLLRRLIRIAPLYWIATTIKVAALLALPMVMFNNTFDIERIIHSYLFIPNRNPAGKIEPIHGVGWTLTFEMFFYVIFAVGMLLKAPIYRFVGVILAFCAGMSLLRDPATWSPLTVYFDPIVLEFFWGMLIGRIAMQRSLPPAVGLAMLIAGFAILLSPEIAAALPEVIRRTGVAPTLVVAGVVFLEPALGGRIPRPALLLGDASYSLYLFHPILAPAVPAAFARLGLINPDLSTALAVLLSVLASIVIYKAVELPSYAWLRTALRRQVGK